MIQEQLPTQIPTSLHRFFWDVDVSKLNPQDSSGYIINRLLDKGNIEAARWVLNNFPRENIVDTLKTRQDFSPWNGTYWANYFDIPREEVKCLNPSYLSMRKKHWSY